MESNRLKYFDMACVAIYRTPIVDRENSTGLCVRMQPAWSHRASREIRIGMLIC